MNAIDVDHAKHLRSLDRSATESIYAIKAALLHALVRAGRAKVYTFESERESRHMLCDGCGRDWIGDSYCYGCDDATGGPVLETVQWFLVDCGGGYRFHSPAFPDDLARFAAAIEPHDPNQPVREVADLGLTDEAMRLIVTTATQRLSDVAVAWTPTLFELAQEAFS